MKEDVIRFGDYSPVGEVRVWVMQFLGRPRAGVPWRQRRVEESGGREKGGSSGLPCGLSPSQL